MGATKVERYVTHLARDRHVLPATHRQADSALFYLYREVLDVNPPSYDGSGFNVAVEGRIV